MSIREDVVRMQDAFWKKFKGEITQEELEELVKKIMVKDIPLFSSLYCGEKE